MADKNWKICDMSCGHLVDHSDSYVDDDNVIRIRYTCTEGCRTKWIKLMKVPLPDAVRMMDDEFPFPDTESLSDYKIPLPDTSSLSDDKTPPRCKWENFTVDSVILFDRSEYEIAFKSTVKIGILHTHHVIQNVNILHLRPLFNRERVIVIVEESGKLTPLRKTNNLEFGLGKINPGTSEGYESWREDDVALMRERVMLYLEMKGADLSAL